MENLKPLKWFAGTALVCLLIFLTVPDGRLNTLFALRNYKLVSSETNRGLVGPNKFLFENEHNITVNVEPSDPDPWANRRAFLERSAQSNDLAIIAFAARKIRAADTDDLSRNQLLAHESYVETCRKIINKGIQLDPENAFFPLILATLEHRQGNSRQASLAIQSAANCVAYKEYIREEVNLKIAAHPFAMSVLEETLLMYAVEFPHLSLINQMVKSLVSQDLPPTSDLRVQFIRIGKLISTSNEAHVTMLVGKSIVSEAIPKSTAPSGRTTEYRAELLEPLESEERELVNRAIQFAKSDVSTPITFFAEVWPRILINHAGAPLILFIPVLAIAVTLVALIVQFQKIANRRGIKPIRYLALVPLSLLLASNGNELSFHIPVIIAILVVSIPVALIAATEKFVPFIHSTIVALSVGYFAREQYLSSIIAHVTLISIMTIGAWYKNRNEDSKIARYLSHTLLVALILVSLYWLVFSLPQSSTNQYLGIGTIFISVLGITHHDRQTAYQQANTIASIGLGLFIASMVASLHLTAILKNYTDQEWNFVTIQQQRTTAIFKDPTTANNPPAPNVKQTR